MPPRPLRCSRDGSRVGRPEAGEDGRRHPGRRPPVRGEIPMTVAAQMLDSYPQDLAGVDREKLRACIEACVECAQACTACADACLSEDMVAELTKCIHTCA